MKRIGLFLTASPWGGGMYQYSAAVLSALLPLPRNDYTLVVAFTNPAWKRLLPADVERHPLHFSRALRAMASLWALLGLPHRVWLRYAASFSSTVREIVKQKCDLWIFPRQDLWSSRFPVRTVGAIHDLMHRYERQFSESAGFGRGRYRDKYLSDLCSHAACILVDSKVGALHVCESYKTDAGKIFVLPYIPPPYIFEDRAAEDFDSKYRLPKKFFFYPAQFWPHKNHARLIRALSSTRIHGAQIHLVLTGDDRNECASLRALVDRLQIRDQVHFAGCVPEQDIAEFYGRARALIFPTFYGPTNIPPIEAFALGCPAAVSGIYGMPEQVGDAALLFDPRSEAEMADCMLRLWEDDELCRRLSVAGEERARTWGQQDFNSRLRILVEKLVVQDSTFCASQEAVAAGTGSSEAVSVQM